MPGAGTNAILKKSREHAVNTMRLTVRKKRSMRVLGPKPIGKNAVNMSTAIAPVKPVAVALLLPRSGKLSANTTMIAACVVESTSP